MLALISIAEIFSQNYVINRFKETFPESFFSDLSQAFLEHLKQHPVTVELGDICLDPEERNLIGEIFRLEYKQTTSTETLFKGRIPIWICLHQTQLPRRGMFEALCREGAKAGFEWPVYATTALTIAAPIWIFGKTDFNEAERSLIKRVLPDTIQICMNTCDGYAERAL